MQSIFTPKSKIIISRSDAKSTGHARYYTGKPCSQGHTVQRQVSNCGCLDCIELSRIKYANDNHQAVSQSSARYKSSDKGKAAQKKANDKYLAKKSRKAAVVSEYMML